MYGDVFFRLLGGEGGDGRNDREGGDLGRRKAADDSGQGGVAMAVAVAGFIEIRGSPKHT